MVHCQIQLRHPASRTIKNVQPPATTPKKYIVGYMDSAEFFLASQSAGCPPASNGALEHADK
jgi:hypothetical protein